MNECTSITSIMDGAYKELMDPNDPSKGAIYVRHCDSLTGPHLRDRTLVKDMYIRGTLAEVRGANNGNGTATFSWQDDAWGETRHESMFMYSKGLSITDPWLMFAQTSESAGIEWVGQHREILGQEPEDSHIFRFTVNLNYHMTPGKRLPYQTIYIACVRAYFERIGGYGPRTCSNEIIVSNSEHNEGLPTFTPTPTAKPKPTATRTPRSSRPTATPRPPTATPKPPTATPRPPTATPRPPTATPKPPTATPRPPTATPRPPTATPRPSAPRPTPTTHPCDINPLDCPHWFR